MVEKASAEIFEFYAAAILRPNNWNTFASNLAMAYVLLMQVFQDRDELLCNLI